MNPVVGRLAPSPTGYLHLGHARTFLLAWWSARSQNGKIVLRIEDLDTQRSQRHFIDSCCEDLEWLGMDWDTGPRLQSQGLERILATAAELEKQGYAFPCICTRGDVLASQSAPHIGDHEPRYPGTCRGRFGTLRDANRLSGAKAYLRFKVSPGLVTVQDRVAGTHVLNVAEDVGDFPITRRDQSPAYQLAVVVDDIHDGVTEVYRGDDLLASAARQQLLYNALGKRVPQWIHVPLVTDSSSRRLAKRADDVSLRQLREKGISPATIVRWVAQSAGFGEHPLSSARDGVGLYRDERIPTAPVCAPSNLQTSGRSTSQR